MLLDGTTELCAMIFPLTVNALSVPSDVILVCAAVVIVPAMFVPLIVSAYTLPP